MNLELILWFVALILTIELIFIWMLRQEVNDSWIQDKILSFIIGVIILIIQFFIVFPMTPEIEGLVWGTGNYINLLWEFSIVGGIVLFFYLNKLVARKIEGGKE